MRYAGADWIHRTLGKELSPFAVEVADLIGTLVHGIYHVSAEVKKIDWSNTYWIEWRTHMTFASTDFAALTELVVLAHDRCIRVNIEPCSRTTLRILFTPRKRKRDPDDYSVSLHPTLEENMERIREYQDHA